jgi:hypothetical protein
VRKQVGDGGGALRELVLHGLAEGRDEDEDEDKGNSGKDDLLDVVSSD